MRQLLISDGTTAAGGYTNNVLAAGAIDVVGLSSNGFTSLVTGDDIADYPAIRLVQGTVQGVNIVSPWIDGLSVTRWTGQSFDAQQAQSSTLTFATPPIAAGQVTVKLISANGGQAQFPRKSVTIDVSVGQAVAGPGGIVQNLMVALTGQTPAVIAANPGTDYAIVGADFAVAQYAGSVITVTGTIFNIGAGTSLSSFRTASEGLDGSNGTTLVVAAAATPDLGNGGDGNLIAELEASLQGSGRGYYDRVQLPVVPPSYADVTASYDLYKLSFNNGAEGNIKGVDNYREIFVAYPAGGAGQAYFEGQINPWITSTPGTFAAVNL
jgi:hypothetical protein